MITNFLRKGEPRGVEIDVATIRVLLFVLHSIDRVRDGDLRHVARQLSTREDKVELNTTTPDWRATVRERVVKAAVEPVGSANAWAFSRVPARKVGERSECRCLHGCQPAPSRSHTRLEHLGEARPIVHPGEPGPTGECMHSWHGATWLRVA